MALPNPWYIDAQARHLATQQRLLAYAAVEGQEGVLANEHFAVRALGTPTDQVQAMPGGYSVLARHLGGNFEAYLGKLQEAEPVSVSPTSSSGPRTDLVILRIENPYVSGSGSWAMPNDPIGGPYAFIRVIEGVPANINHVSGHNNTWSAITLARITRPASTGIVTQAHITDLRSLAKLDGQRVIIIENPPADPPPIAQQYWTESTPCDANDVLLKTQNTFTNYPAEASWQVPVPAWATGFDLLAWLNPEIDNHVFGEMRIAMSAGSVNNDPGGAVPARYDVNFPQNGPGPIRELFMVGGTVFLQPALRGKVVTMKLQARSLDAGNHPGKLKTAIGTRVNVMINFKRNPSYNP